MHLSRQGSHGTDAVPSLWPRKSDFVFFCAPASHPCHCLLVFLRCLLLLCGFGWELSVPGSCSLGRAAAEQRPAACSALPPLARVECVCRWVTNVTRHAVTDGSASCQALLKSSDGLVCPAFPLRPSPTSSLSSSLPGKGSQDRSWEGRTILA